MRLYLLLGGLLGYLAGISPAVAQSPIQVDHADDQTIYFTTAIAAAPPVNPAVTPSGTAVLTGGAAPAALKPPLKPLKTGLFDLQYIGPLNPADDSIPYFLFAGNPCKNCASERALYLVRPVENAAPQVTSFVYPGKVLDPKNHGVVLEARAFYGNCLMTSGYPKSRGDDFYVVFQRERVDRRHGIQPSVFIAQASSDFLREKLIERGMPPIKRTLTLVKSKNCHEIVGHNRTFVLKPQGLNWRNMQPDENDDDDEDRDNQTDQDLTPAAQD
jgi:hypothetical protein